MSNDTRAGRFAAHACHGSTRHIESLEVAGIARRDRGTPRLGNTGDQRIAQVDGAAGPLALGKLGR
jgi:hypothetical protein